MVLSVDPYDEVAGGVQANLFQLTPARKVVRGQLQIISVEAKPPLPLQAHAKNTVTAESRHRSPKYVQHISLVLLSFLGGVLLSTCPGANLVLCESRRLLERSEFES